MNHHETIAGKKRLRPPTSDSGMSKISSIWPSARTLMLLNARMTSVPQRPFSATVGFP